MGRDHSLESDLADISLETAAFSIERIATDDPATIPRTINVRRTIDTSISPICNEDVSRQQSERSNSIKPNHAIRRLSNTAYPDSDDSWTSDDHLEEWQFRYHQDICRFDANKTLRTMLTDPLTSRQRKVIHHMASVRRLSHMSVGTGATKRILISKCDIFTAVKRQRPWNPFKLGQYRRYRGITIEPRVVTYRSFLEVDLPLAKVIMNNSLAVIGIAQPSQVVLQPLQLMNETCLRVLFDNPADAAAAVYALPSYFEYACIRGTFKEDLAANVVLFPVFLNTVRLPPIPTRRKLPLDRSRRIQYSSVALTQPSGDTSRLGSTISDRPLEVLQHPTSPTTQGTPIGHIQRTDRSGYVSSGSNFSQGSAIRHETVFDSASDISSSKRKRLPPGTYDCSFEGCGKTFSHAGERTKHEKVHRKEDWQYRCDECGHVFQHRKDLRRHHNNTGHSATLAGPSSSAAAELQDNLEASLTNTPC